MYYLTARADFDAAHFLKGHDGKCANLHGHRWGITAKLAGETLQPEGSAEGMLIDFADFKRCLRDLAEELDHRFLVQEGTLRAETLAALEAEGFAMVMLDFRPTAENLARYLFARLRAAGYPICEVTVHETPDNGAIYGEGSR